MVNFGRPAAEIGSVVSGTPTNFNGFCSLAALLHGTSVVSVCQLCGVEQRAPLTFGRAAIALGIGPHSSCHCSGHVVLTGIATEPVEPASDSRESLSHVRHSDDERDVNR